MTLRWRSIWVGVISVVMFYYALPTFFSPEKREASDWILDEGLNLGLDLQGGIHWLLRIDVDEAIDQELKAIQGRLTQRMADQGRETVGIEILESGEIEVQDPSDEVRALLTDEFPSLQVQAHAGSLLLRLTEEVRREVIARGVRQALEVLRTRVDEKGVREPVIAPQGDDRILVQMPGEVDPVRVRDILDQTTFLEFKLVHDSANNVELLQARLEEGIPEDRQIVVEENDLGEVTRAYLVDVEPVLTGASLADARMDFDQLRRPQIAFQWDDEGTAIFREFTKKNIKRPMAIIVDKKVLSAPVIQDRIGRNGVITGDFTKEEAADLAVQLRSGALPIPLQIEEERTVGPALGADSIRRGLRSILIGGALVLVFMLIYYQTAGVVANAALTLNILLILGLMGMAGATLTLPGIAGLVLTVGMAVDANVIIFERIREELRSGKSVRNAIQAGFKRSSLTILDANITTMIAAIVLLYYGRGPVQGFGVTLAIGIMSSVFCALVVTRLFVDWIMARGAQTLRV